MNLYLDTSSLLKLFVAERESDQVRAVVANLMASAFTSLVSLPELRGGLARAHRGRRVTDEELTVAEAELERLLIWVQIIELDRQTADTAGDLAAEYFLRGLDAIHLASALALQQRLGEPVTFSAFDDRLMEAAADAGLAVP